MSTDNKIDFEPGLFNGGLAKALPSRPAVRHRHRLMVLLLAGLVGAGVAGVVVTMPGAIVSRKNVATLVAPERDDDPIPEAVPMSSSAAQPIAPYPEEWCDSGEVLCTKILTGNPAKTLQKLIAALPPGTASQYVIRLSVMPVEDTPSGE